MGNNSSSKKQEHRHRRGEPSRRHPQHHGLASIPREHSQPPSYHTTPDNMADFNWRSTGPLRPGMVSYESPKHHMSMGADFEGQSTRSYTAPSHGFGMYIDRLTAIWSDLEALNNIPESSLSEESYHALRKVFERLLDNHNYVTTLSKDHDHVSKQNRNMIEDKEVLTNKLRERESTIQQLQSSLKAFQDSPRTAPLVTQTHTRQGSDGFRRQLKPAIPVPDARLRERLVELEEQLKHYKEEGTRASPEKELERIDEIQNQYMSLQSYGLHQIKQVVDHVSKQMAEDEKLKMIYTVLVIALEKSHDLLDSLKTMIRKLVHHPDRFQTAAFPGGDSSGDKSLEHRTSLIVRENVKLFENREADLHHEVRKRKVSQERVNTIFQHLRLLMSEEADGCKLTNLETEVVEAMKTSYGPSIHASLWFDSKFTKFLTDSCKLAWKIALTGRQIVLDFVPYEHYNSKRHLPYNCEACPMMKVDYFAWPILVDLESKYTLCKGKAHLV